MSEEKKPQDNGDQKKKDGGSFWNGFDTNHGNGGSSRGPNRPKKPFALILFGFLVLTFTILFLDGSLFGSSSSVSYTEFLAYVDSNQVSRVEIEDNTDVTFQLRSGATYQTRIPYYDDNILGMLNTHGVVVVGTQRSVSFLYVILQLLPWVIFIGFTVMLYRQASGMNGKMMGGLGKSLAKEYKRDENKTTFRDVAGQEEAKCELQEVVEFLKNPQKFQKIGAHIPKGVLLVGPPGTGKTLIAKAVAGESGVSFFHTSGSDFVEMFVGMGAARVRDLFEQGRKNAPCIIFIDEIDAVGRSRGSGLGGGHDEREQTLNQILVEMDGFSTQDNVIVMAATNRADVLDPALLRPGRFDRQVVVELPDVKEREAILRIHAKKIKADPELDYERIARATPGCSGADLANMINEAALLAARADKSIVSIEDVEQARDKVLFGVARKSRVMTNDEKVATAYHEAGHTLLHYYLKHTDPLHKVTIIPHGRALGITMSLPVKDAYTKNKSMLLDWIKVTMGGYVAEELVYGETTTGTSNDIKQATDTAKRMVTEWGMSDLGFINLGDEDQPLFLGRELSQHKNYSEETARRIDKAMSEILDGALKEVREILSTHRDQLDLLTQELVKKETLDDAEIRELLGFEPVENITSLKD